MGITRPLEVQQPCIEKAFSQSSSLSKNFDRIPMFLTNSPKSYDFSFRPQTSPD